MGDVEPKREVAIAKQKMGKHGWPKYRRRQPKKCEVPKPKQ